MKTDTTLLDKPGVPTVEELKVFFKKHDYTCSSHKYDVGRASAQEQQIYRKAKDYFYSSWCKSLKAADIKNSQKNYSAAYPVKLLGQTNADLISSQVMQVLDSPELMAQTTDIFFSALEEPLTLAAETYAKAQNKQPDDLSEEEIRMIVDKVADELINVMTQNMMLSQSVPEICGITKEHGDYSDFNENVADNHDKIDFARHWDHIRYKGGLLLSFDDLDSDTENPDPDCIPYQNDPALTYEDSYEQLYEEDDEKILQEFLKTLDEEDLKIVKMLMKRYSQSLMAEALNYKTQSAVSKRVAKIKEKFYRFMNERQPK